MFFFEQKETAFVACPAHVLRVRDSAFKSFLLLFYKKEGLASLEVQ
jgi:hypothetical protein